MKQTHRTERQKLKDGRDKRWTEETKVRSERLNKGLRGLFDHLTGKAKSIRSENALDARSCAIRDQKQRDFMVNEQMKERQKLQSRIDKQRIKHKQDRRILAQSVTQSIRNTSRSQSIDQARIRRHGPDLSL